MPRILRNLRIHEISVVDKGANPGAKVVLYKRAESKTLTKSWSERLAKVFSRTVRKESAMTIDDVLASLPDDQKAVVMAALEQAAQKAAPPPPPPTDGEKPPVGKRADVPEEVQKRLDEYAAEIAAMKAEKRRESFIAKAKALPFIPGKTEDTALLLEKAADSMKPEDYAAFEKKLGVTNAALEKSNALKELGSSASGDSDSVRAKVAALADGMVAKSAAGLTHAQAVLRVLKQNPELYAEYDRERSQSAS